MVAMAESPMRTGRSCRAVASVYGTYIDEVLCMVKANGDRYYYATNDLYSVYALTDSDGTVVERYTYDPYGSVTVLDGNGTPRTVNESLYGNPWTFTGRRLDQETGLMYFRNRMYDVGLGRFVGRDPLGQIAGPSEYLASYIPHDTDPDGLFPWSIILNMMEGGIAHRLIELKYHEQFGAEPRVFTERSVSTIASVGWGVANAGSVSRFPDIAHVHKVAPCFTEIYEIKPDHLAGVTLARFEASWYAALLNKISLANNSIEKARASTDPWPMGLMVIPFLHADLHVRSAGMGAVVYKWTDRNGRPVPVFRRVPVPVRVPAPRPVNRITNPGGTERNPPHVYVPPGLPVIPLPDYKAAPAWTAGGHGGDLALEIGGVALVYAGVKLLQYTVPPAGAAAEAATAARTAGSVNRIRLLVPALAP